MQLGVEFDTLEVLSCVLCQLCDRNESAKATQNSKFQAKKVPTISVHDYLQRIAKYSECSREVFILALIYIDRIIQCNHNFIATYHNIHRLTVVALMLGAKFFDDNYYNNSYYAKIGGVTTSEINELEVEFLFMNNFSLFVTSEVFNQYCQELQSHRINSNNTCYCGRSRHTAEQQPAVQSSPQSHSAQGEYVEDQPATSESSPTYQPGSASASVSAPIPSPAQPTQGAV